MARVSTDIITSAFALLESKISLNSHLNLQDINIHLENILRDILNIIYTDRQFINLNTEKGNYTSIDLGDNINDISFQVTSTTTPKKVRETISKYKDDYNFKKVIMLYGKIQKPKRTIDFETEIDGRFKFEEWDFSMLVENINDCKSHEINQIQQILINEVIPKISDNFKIEDDSGTELWDNLEQKDIRNFKDKLLDVNSNIRDARIEMYCREIASGKVELSNYSEREISAMKYRVFEICQKELLDFCDENEKKELTHKEINNLITNYTEQAYKIIEERTKDYSYPFKNKDTLKKIVLALIDECYLSFDEKGIYL
ncbi:SMEK domain-containing protein [Mariniflexile sp. AS56]|uniref:SMEK domain-containing protein n=1 Tax=Mariniflexile sp. AS56 TaxID=3063957 RepID=UPI0026EA9D39|nr:SMEK domain-containing protein [Mariniflexile sp. AS56]MDO7172549.1 SMEK domain-containing protein [Mariniflexile sp. AS56]